MKNVDATAAELRRMLKPCPACGANLDDHWYALCAVTVAAPENKERLGDFCRTLKAHDWPRLIQFDDFDPLLNALEVFVIKCISGAMVLLAVRNPFELYETKAVLDCEVLASVTGKELDSLIESQQWQRLSVSDPAA